ncbi:MAG: hypothetical protein JXR37_18210 [Kiritimatiellae bacterium]|nr:hypothetical protein [Kiritimatiellia bacterium]
MTTRAIGVGVLATFLSMNVCNGRKTWSPATRLGFSGDTAPVDKIVIGASRAGGQQAGALLDELLVFDTVLDGAAIGALMGAEKVSVPERREPAAPALTAFEAERPAGVKAVWDLGRAYREATPTQERICINGLWRWQPGAGQTEQVPAGNWGFFKVPGSWPGTTSYNQKDSQVVHAHPAWKAKKWIWTGTAWYEREIAIPREWSGRRIAVQADYVNSYADVYVDGKKAGELHFPGGEADITTACRPGATHRLSLYMVAMPLHAVMLSYNDSNSAKEKKGSVQRRGLCGDVFLVGAPAAERVGDVKIDTSVRNWRITLHARLQELKANGAYRLSAVIRDRNRTVKELESEPFTAADAKDGRFSFEQAWKPEKLWDVHTPQNTYTLQLSLLDAAGRALDTSCPIRFGFRELWIDGRDFIFNGTRLFCNAVPLDTGLIGAAWANYEAARENMLRLMAIGINLVYTHNYSCVPGSHLGYEEILRAADDVGMLISFSQPHFGHYKWEQPDADETNGYARHAAFYVRMAQNHPSVVMYSTSHNATGYYDDMNPDMIDGIHESRSKWSMNNVKKALRAEAIVKRIDPTRILYHHSSGNLGSMHTSNFYLNWVPVQERSDWFEHWATKGVKPVFLVEYGMPCAWNWAMYRGWYKGKRTFGGAKVPWEFCLAEWNAQFLGDAAFRISDMEKTNLRWEAEKFRAGERWHRWDYPYVLGGSTKRFLERHPIWALYNRDNWRAFRTWGVSATSPWTFGVNWLKPEGVDRGRKELATDWDNLQRPGFSPDFIEGRYERMDLAFERADWVPSVAGKALVENSQPLLAYIGGKPGQFTEKGHNFLPGATVEKQIIVINNSRKTVDCECAWSLALPEPVTGRQTIPIDTGQIERRPLRFALPATLKAGTYTLTLDVAFSSGEKQQDRFELHVLAPPAKPGAAGRMALFDPKGETATLLRGMGIACDPVQAGSDLSRYRVLVVGRGALTMSGAAPDISSVCDGLKVVLFEQTPDVLEKRFGFRIVEYGLRRVFARVAGHPVLSGISGEHLGDWRGEATIVPPRQEFKKHPERAGPHVMRAGIMVSRPWRCGNRGNVASVLIEKPARGDFLPIIDGGFSLQYSPLIEYREGKGLVVFCQMDVTGRTEDDPAADRIVRNLLDYVSAWQPTPRRRAVYAGDPAGFEHLKAAGIAAHRLNGGPLAPDQVLVLGPGSGKALAGKAAALGTWLAGGGRLLGIGLEQSDVAALPFPVSVKSGEHIAAYFEPQSLGSPFVGLAPADVHNRDPRKIALIAGGEATPTGNGVLGVAQDGRAVFCQLAPWTFDVGKANQKRTFRRLSTTVSRLLGNMGVGGQTPLLNRFAVPVGGQAVAADAADTVWLEQDGRTLSLPAYWKGLPRTNGKTETSGWETPAFDDGTWRKIRVPGLWEEQFSDLTEFNGMFLYRVRFDLPKKMAGRDVTLVLGAVDDEDWTYVNGKLVGSITAKTNPKDYWIAPRHYRVPASVLKPGVNVIAVKVNDLRQAGGIKGELRTRPSQDAGAARWAKGLYLDTPEEWDDPYRFFRW